MTISWICTYMCTYGKCTCTYCFPNQGNIWYVLWFILAWLWLIFFLMFNVQVNIVLIHCFIIKLILIEYPFVLWFMSGQNPSCFSLVYVRSISYFFWFLYQVNILFNTLVCVEVIFHVWICMSTSAHINIYPLISLNKSILYNFWCCT